MASTIQLSPVITTCAVPPPLGKTSFFRSHTVAAIMVGIESRKLNSSADGRSIPTNCPAAMVDMERDVPGKIAESVWQRPIQMACGRLISSTCVVLAS